MNSRARNYAGRQRAQTRQTYEKYPYPTANRTALTTKGWRLAPMEWIMALWQPGNEDYLPKRILVAGCGTGSEAFMLKRKFPTARIVALDFSARSISIAKKLQRKAKLGSIRFLSADLTDRRLAKITGGEFDLISCHGVLSYIPEPERVLANLARQLKPNGAFFLGVNGSEHPSARGRPFLSSFGFDLIELREEKRLHKLLEFWNSLLESQGRPSLAIRTTAYLAGDLFGPLIHNWPLSRWTTIARKAGFHLCDSYSSWRKRRSLMENENAALLIPRSRAEVSRLLDLLVPEGFHRLLFVKQKPWNPPWEDHRSLLNSRPARSQLYSLSRPCRPRARQALTKAILKSRPLNTRLDWKIPPWEAKILRQADGQRTLREILQGVQGAGQSKLIRQQLYIMHQLLVLTLLPPNEKR